MLLSGYWLHHIYVLIMAKFQSSSVELLILIVICSAVRRVQNHSEGDRRVTLSQHSGQTCDSKDRECKEQGLLGDDELVRLDGVKVGHVQEINLVDGQTHKLLTRSMRPLLFEIANFLSDDDCDHIIKLAEREGLAESQTVDTGEDNAAYDSMKTITTDAVDENQEQIKQCKEMIEGYDLNKNGLLDGTELAPYLENVSAILLKEKEILTMLQDLNFDEDKDGELSYEECLKVNVSAVDEYLDMLEDNHPNYRSRTSKHTWLHIDEESDPVLVSLRNKVKKLTRLPDRMIEQSEDLQVVRYSVGGYFHAHYDSTDIKDQSCCHYLNNKNGSTNCNLCRYMTILYYLNNVTRGGETAFPVADNQTYDRDEYDRRGLSNLSTRCYQSNIYVPPRKGTAILWYNHHIDPDTGLMGQMDQFSLHGGCDVQEGVKWIANNWINDYR